MTGSNGLLDDSFGRRFLCWWLLFQRLPRLNVSAPRSRQEHTGKDTPFLDGYITALEPQYLKPGPLGRPVDAEVLSNGPFLYCLSLCIL